MKNENTAVTVNLVFAGNKSYEELFLDLLREKINKKSKKRAALSGKICYNDNMVFPDVHA